jgi:hypothetical protein
MILKVLLIVCAIVGAIFGCIIGIRHAKIEYANSTVEDRVFAGIIGLLYGGIMWFVVPFAYFIQQREMSLRKS